MSSNFPTFPEFFEAVHGHAPYAWQVALSEYLTEHGTVPGRVAVPTGLGKTSTVDAVVWELARQLHHGLPRTIGQRVFLVVERRVIAEGTGDHITALVDAINAAEPGGTLEPVLTALRSLSVTGEGPVATTFHGSRRAEGPLTPTGVTIISTTATQLTLRLAGRAPGMGPSRRASEAGLAMVDATILFDEPHLAAPQVGSVTSAIRAQRKFAVPGVPAPQISVLGATIPPGLVTDPGEVSFSAGTETEAARARFSPYRPLDVVEVEPADTAAALESAVRDNVVADEGRRRRRRVLVIANTVAAAEKIHSALSKKTPEGYTVRLVTGRFRATEAPTAEGLGTPGTITVSTQVVEAGADFTCDLLVSELAPWPALTQRLGRLNRDGSAKENALAIVVAPRSSKGFGTDGTRMVYGPRPVDATGVGLVAAYAAAVENATKYHTHIQASPEYHPALVERMLGAVRSNTDKNMGLPEDADVSVFWPAQVSPATISPEIGSAYLETAAPVMPADTWRMGIDPADRRPEPVTVAWRGVAPGDTLAGALLGRMPLAGETVQVPLTLARALVVGSRFTDGTDGTDDSLVAKPSSKDSAPVEPGTAVVYRRGEWRPVRRARDVFPGSSLVIDADRGGYTDDRGVVSGSRTTVSETSLLLALREGRWAPVTASSLLGAGVPDEDKVELLDALYPESTEESPEECPTKAARIRAATPVARRLWAGSEVRFVGSTAAVFMPTGGDPEGLVTLEDHLVQVGDTAGSMARAAGVAEDLSVSIERAGWLHDVGKAIPAYQRRFNAPDGALVAKPVGTPSRAAVGLPDRWRHEFASLNVCGSEDLLTRWLIASHHGRGRGPWFGQVGTAAVGWMRRELETVYGPWGVAYLEAVLKAADADASAAPRSGLHAPVPEVREALAEVQGGDAETLGSPAVPTRGTDFRLEGLADASFISVLAAAGAVVAMSTADPGAALRWDDTTPVLTTTADARSVLSLAGELWDAAFSEVLVHDGEERVGSNHKFRGVTPHQLVELSQREYTEALSPALASAALATHLTRPSLEDAMVPSAMGHSNSNIIKAVSPGESDPAALFDPSVGWASGAARETGRLDVTEHTAGTVPVRLGVTALARIGALAVPQAVTRGLGITPTAPGRRVFSLPQVPMHAGEVLSVLRAGDVAAEVSRSGAFVDVKTMKYTYPGELVRA